MKTSIKSLLIASFLGVWLSLSPSTTSAATVRLAWDASVTPTVTGHYVYGWTNSVFSITNPPAFKVDVKTNRVAAVENVSSSTWRFAVTAYTSPGVESEFSNVVVVEFPQPPTQMRTVVLQYNASIVTTNWQDAGFFRVQIQ